MVGPRSGARQRRLGQNFLVDPNLLDVIIREGEVGGDDVVLEVGAGGGSLSDRLAERCAHLHAVEMDERLGPALEPLAERANVTVHWADALHMDLAALRPAPGKVVANLPYSVATPVIVRTIEELPSVGLWVVMVQREIAERLAARPGRGEYGAPSVIVQLACDVEYLRTVGRTVFSPPPRVDSALIKVRRRRQAGGRELSRLVHGAFAHRRKMMARSLELAGIATRDDVRTALDELELNPSARAEALAPEEFEALAQKLGIDPGPSGRDRG